MKKQLLSTRWWAQSIGIGAAIVALTASAHATPVVDGTLDAEYGAAVATSPKDNLTVDATAGINDPADTALAKPSDVTNVYVTNSGNALYIYVRLPYYNLQTMHGDWAIPVHLGGANDGIAVASGTTDPYADPISYSYPKNPSVVIKSNVISNTGYSDGNNGYAFINTTNSGFNGWQFNGGDYFGTAAAGKPSATATTFHSVGSTGAEICYANGDGTGNTGGIEMKIPFVDFAHDGNLTAPVVGDILSFQFYITTRDSNNNHPRAAIDSSPYEAGIRSQPNGTTGDQNYALGIATQQVAYTIKSAITPFDVSRVGFTDLTHIFVQFADNAGTGATTPANYVVTDTDNGNAAVAVSAATVNGTNGKEVDLTTASLTYGHHYKVVVNNAQSLGGVVVTPTANSGTFQAPVPATFTLVDNGGLVPPGKLPFIAFFVGAGGTYPTVAVAGQTNQYTTTTPVLITPGTVQYKFVIEDSLGNITDYDTLNRRNRNATITAAGPNNFTLYIGNPITVTFNLTDYTGTVAAAIAAGKEVDLFDFDSDPSPAIRFPLTPVAGKTNVFTTGPQSLVQNATEYKYVIVTNSGQATEADDYDTLNGSNRTVDTGAGNVATLIVNDVNGTPPSASATDILKVVGGLVAGPASTDASFSSYDKNGDGKITLLDAAKATHP